SRIQAPYISEKEVKRVADFVIEQGKKIEDHQSVMTNSLQESLERSDAQGKEGGDVFFGDEDPLLEEVKKIVLETKKASASFL
ncbi:MAG: hypothetical protein HYT36_02250, partial [Candidatus Staskawiczbacteria bacterium]|nr:hypothetical protein [Candidatus Staskawiczbacteria bacterium]